jgi:hypothetical protein
MKKNGNKFRIVDGRHRLIALNSITPPPTEKISAIVLKPDTPIEVQQTIAYNENEAADVTVRPAMYDRMKALCVARNHLKQQVGPKSFSSVGLEQQLTAYKKMCPQIKSTQTLGFWMKCLQCIEYVGGEVSVSPIYLLAASAPQHSDNTSCLLQAHLNSPDHLYLRPLNAGLGFVKTGRRS